MKNFAIFLMATGGDVQEGCGSDSVFRLDGRSTVRQWVIDCKQQMHRLRFVQTSYMGFTIYEGDLRSSTPIYRCVQMKGVWQPCQKV